VMCSEGLTEARNPQEIVAHQEAAGLVDGVLGDVRGFSRNTPVEDDRTQLLLRLDSG
jgi:hypothetical protein